MHLIESLAAGVRGAEGGYAKVLVRGTATGATWYSTFEATTGNSSGDNIALDSSGRAVVYVNQVVDVRAYSATGELVASYTSGTSAGAVEVRSSSFMGTEYATGQSVVGAPTTLQAVLSLLYASFGALDFEVMYGGSSVSLSSVLSAVLGTQVFNVKADAYGATGDGVADDTSEIAAAIADAALVSGIVLFPPGTYKTSSGVTVPYNVTLLGFGPNSSILAPSHATATHFVFTGNAAAKRFTEVRGLAFLPSASTTGTIVLSNTGSALALKFVDCEIGNSNVAGSLVSVSAATSVTLEMHGCRLVAAGNATPMFLGVHACRFIDTVFKPSSGTLGGLMISGMEVDLDGCTFDNSVVAGLGTTVSTANPNMHPPSAADPQRWNIRRCTFTAPSSNRVIAIATPAGNDVFASSEIHEEGNLFANTVIPYRVRWGTASKGAKCWLGSRVGRRVEIESDAATYEIGIEALTYETVVIKRATNADQTVTYNNVSSAYTALPDGNYSSIMVWNESAGNIAAETFGPRGAGAAVGINQNLSALLHCIWLQVESAVGPYAVAPVVATGDPY